MRRLSKSRGFKPLVLAIVSTFAIAGVQAQDDASQSMPLVIAKQSYFFVGGAYHSFGGAQYVSGQAYVEYQIPKKVKHTYPIVMIEGFGLTGTNFTDA